MTPREVARLIARAAFCPNDPDGEPSFVETEKIVRGLAALRDAGVAVVPVETLRRAQTLVSLLTVRQVIEAGDEAIDAAGLNPWCIAEGIAEGHEQIGAWWLDPPAAGGEPR